MVPRYFHFVFGLRVQEEEFHPVFYLCLKSCITVNKPDKIYFYYHHEPFGSYWDRIKPFLEMVRVQPISHLEKTSKYLNSQEGRFILQNDLTYAHHSDFIRLEALLEKGGVYADMDTIFVRPYPEDLYTKKCVMAPENDSGSDASKTLCNAVIFSEKNSKPIRQWLENMKDVFDGTWNRHSCIEANHIAELYPDDVYIAPRDYFYRYSWNEIDLLFEKNDPDFSKKNIFSIHLWSHLWWDMHRTDFSDFYADLIDEEYLGTYDSTYCRIVRELNLLGSDFE